MGRREIHYHWKWALRAECEALWPLIADTNRFDHDAGLPAVERLDGSKEVKSRKSQVESQGTEVTSRKSQVESQGKRADGGLARHMRLRLAGMTVEWDEEPFEWVRPERFGSTRRYRRGPITEMRFLVELQRRTGGGTDLSYQVWVKPRSLLGAVLAQVQIGWSAARKFGRVMRRYDELALATAAAGPTIDSRLPAAISAVRAPAPVGVIERKDAAVTGNIDQEQVQLSSGGEERLARCRQTLIEQRLTPSLIERLIELVRRGDDMAVARIRPYAWAEPWSATRRAVLELCLHATRAGLLDFQWDILCPLCRGVQQSSSSLRELASTIHCEGCHIDFTANFDRSVELTFRPNPAIRVAELRQYCVGGPGVTPHVVLQQKLEPGDIRVVTLALEPGRFRFRVAGMPGGQALAVGPGGPTAANLRVTDNGWSGDELALALQPELRLENLTDQTQVVMLERMAWSDQATTAAEVTALQVFRDLFSSEALRSGEQISVGALAVLFTDLRGSTRLYRRIGDAPAFGRVMDHFALLRKAIEREQGAIVKTIGDSVMAVFRQPVGALRAVAQVREELTKISSSAAELVLKAGLHFGPCIAVTLNDRLDYFGSTVNIAARLGALSDGQDLVASECVAADPEIVQLLDTGHGPWAAERFEAELKGLEGERMTLWRIRARTDLQVPPVADPVGSTALPAGS